MAKAACAATIKDENKITVISHCDDVIELIDKLDGQNSQALSMDYADDEPRKKAVTGLDHLHRGLYGQLTDRQDAQIVYILQQIAEQERLDRTNDVIKQNERKTMSQIKELAKKIREEYRAK